MTTIDRKYLEALRQTVIARRDNAIHEVGRLDGRIVLIAELIAKIDADEAMAVKAQSGEPQATASAPDGAAAQTDWDNKRYGAPRPGEPVGGDDGNAAFARAMAASPEGPE